LDGQVTSNLTLIGGITALNPKLTQQPNNTLFDGKRPVYVSNVTAKLYAEYGVNAIRGLALTGGIQYYSKQAVNNLNQAFTPGYQIGNIGARYLTHPYGRVLTFRFNFNNLSNENYWIGTDEGDPRSIAVSAQVRF
jgi:iron complex outermembrane receptor protein